MMNTTFIKMGAAVIGGVMIMMWVIPYIQHIGEEISDSSFREKLVISDITNDDIFFYVGLKNLTGTILFDNQINVKVVNPNGEEALDNFINENPDLELITGHYILDKGEGLIQIRLGNIMVGQEYIIVIGDGVYTTTEKYTPR